MSARLEERIGSLAGEGALAWPEAAGVAVAELLAGPSAGGIRAAEKQGDRRVARARVKRGVLLGFWIGTLPR